MDHYRKYKDFVCNQENLSHITQVIPYLYLYSTHLYALNALENEEYLEIVSILNGDYPEALCLSVNFCELYEDYLDELSEMHTLEILKKQENNIERMKIFVEDVDYFCEIVKELMASVENIVRKLNLAKMYIVNTELLKHMDDEFQSFSNIYIDSRKELEKIKIDIMEDNYNEED